MNKLFFKTHKRFLIIVFSILPNIFLFFLFYSEMQDLNMKEKKLESIYQKARKTKDMRNFKKSFLEKYTNTDPYFINNFLENLTFRNKERGNLKKILKCSPFENTEKLKKRLGFLESKKNKLSFKQQEIYFDKFIKETEEKQIKEIEVDKEDIERILSIIENAEIKSPQLIIKDFFLKRTKTDSFVLKMNLIKREFK